MSISKRIKDIFYVLGIFISISMFTIVAVNFLKDARIIKQPISSAFYEMTEETGKKSSNGNGSLQADPKIKVEVINYTGRKGFTDDICKALKEKGFEVTARDEYSKDSIDTVVIERNDKKAGSVVRSVLKLGDVVKWPDEKSAFDVTIKIGRDYEK